LVDPDDDDDKENDAEDDDCGCGCAIVAIAMLNASACGGCARRAAASVVSSEARSLREACKCRSTR
jgi:hypothetical protein